LKEIRTFNEVFKDIKKEVKEHDLSRQARNRGTATGLKGSSDEFEPVQDSGDTDSEVGTIPLDIMDDEQQDIDDDDRQVLNDRILGIINVF